MVSLFSRKSMSGFSPALEEDRRQERQVMRFRLGGLGLARCGCYGRNPFTSDEEAKVQRETSDLTKYSLIHIRGKDCPAGLEARSCALCRA
jgi:hypothetical protein